MIAFRRFLQSMGESGYLRAGRWQGVPLRVHWTTPLVMACFGRFQWVPAFWVGFAVTIFVHEIGHALLVRRYGARVLRIDLQGIGGLCWWEGEVSDRQAMKIAWGGVLAQAALFLVAAGMEAVWGPAQTATTAQLAHAFGEANLQVIAFNLIPIPPLDGARAWKLLTPLVATVKARLARLSRRYRARRDLAHLSKLDNSVAISPEVLAMIEKAKDAALSTPTSRRRRQRK